MSLPPATPARIVPISYYIDFTGEGGKLVPVTPPIHRALFDTEGLDLSGGVDFALNLDRSDRRVYMVRGEHNLSRIIEEAHSVDASSLSKDGMREKEIVSGGGNAFASNGKEDLIIENTSANAALGTQRVAAMERREEIRPQVANGSAPTSTKIETIHSAASPPTTRWRPWTPVGKNTEKFVKISTDGNDVVERQEEHGGYDGDDEDEDDWFAVEQEISPMTNTDNLLLRLDADNVIPKASVYSPTDTEKTLIDVVDNYLKGVETKADPLRAGKLDDASFEEKLRTHVSSSDEMRLSWPLIGSRGRRRSGFSIPMDASCSYPTPIYQSSSQDWPFTRQPQPLTAAPQICEDVQLRVVKPTLESMMPRPIPDIIDKWDTAMQHLEELARRLADDEDLVQAAAMARLGRKLDILFPTHEVILKWEKRLAQLRALHDYASLKDREIADWLLEYLPMLEPVLDDLLMDTIQSIGSGALLKLFAAPDLQELHDAVAPDLLHDEIHDQLNATMHASDARWCHRPEKSRTGSPELRHVHSKPLPPLPLPLPLTLMKPSIPPKSPLRASTRYEDLQSKVREYAQRISESPYMTSKPRAPSIPDSEAEKWLTPKERARIAPSSAIPQPSSSSQAPAIYNEPSHSQSLATGDYTDNSTIQDLPLCNSSFQPIPLSPSKVRSPYLRSALRQNPTVDSSPKKQRQVTFDELIDIQNTHGDKVVERHNDHHRESLDRQKEQRFRLKEEMNREEGEALRCTSSLSEYLARLHLSDDADDEDLESPRARSMIKRFELGLWKWQKNQSIESGISASDPSNQRVVHPDEIWLRREQERLRQAREKETRKARERALKREKKERKKAKDRLRQEEVHKALILAHGITGMIVMR